MRKLKSTLKVLFILVLGLTVNLSMAQTETEDVKVKKKEKKITISKVKVVNGEKVKWDTTLVITKENKEEIEKYLKEHADIDAEMNVELKFLDDEIKMKLHEIKEHKIHVYEVQKAIEGEEGLKKHIEYVIQMSDEMNDKMKNVIKISEASVLMELDEDLIKEKIEIAIEAHDGKLELIELKEGNIKLVREIMKQHEGQLHKLKDLHKHGDGFVYVTKDGDSATVKIDLDFDMDHDFDVDKDAENHMIWVSEDGKHKDGMKRMEFIRQGDKKGNVMFFSDDESDAKFSFTMDTKELNEEDLAVLKTADIKMKSTELAIDRLRLTYEDDDFGLIFKLKTEGKATVKVIDSEGKVVFSDKVQYFPGTYHKSIGLNNENEGYYYIYIEQGGANYSTKIHLN